MSVFKRPVALAVKSIILFLIIMSSCKSEQSCPYVASRNDIVTGDKWPKKIYVPQYYIYNRGKYVFVKGHYRYIIFPKLYAKRTMKGYTTKPVDAASAR